MLPVFTSEDSFMKADYVIVSKKIGMGSTLSGRSNAFESSEIEDLRNQPFATKVGAFTTTEYKVSVNMGVNGTSVLNSELFFESIPDSFVDVPLSLLKYSEGSKEVPVILPRSYIAMYNFGFAQSHSLPRISDGLVGMIDLKIFVQGNGHKDEYKGKVIGFSSRLNTILVPQKFMDWSNKLYAPEQHSEPSRLIAEVGNPADENISQYLDKKGYEVDTDIRNVSDVYMGPASYKCGVDAVLPTRSNGEDETAGITSTTGAVGGIGPTGSNGKDGAMGPTGATGAVGAVGPTGRNGKGGAMGPTGATGAVGADCHTGSKVKTGYMGPRCAHVDVGSSVLHKSIWQQTT